MDKNLYIEFTKKDDDKKVVEGFASTESLDSQGEVVKLEAIEKALPNYMKFANIREMHKWSAVGKTIHAKIDKAKKGLFIVGKVVDKDAWEKVKEGVYNGFSIGGKIRKRVDNVIEEIVLNEISLVDRPANPDAVFSMVKIDHPHSEREDDEYEEVMIGGFVVDLARSLRMLIRDFEATGRSTKELSSALTILKNLAAKVLSGNEKKKFNKILYGIDFKELEVIKPKVEKIEKPKIKKYVNESWSPGYFDQMKKVIG